MRATGTKDRAPRSPRARWALITGGAAAVAVLAVGAGLWATSGTPDEPHPEDVYATAPGCDTVPSEEVEALLGEAVLDTDTTGPLDGGEHTACAWTSNGEDGGGALRVGLTARFTDPSGDSEVTGDERTAEALAAAEPEDGQETDPADGEARVWAGTVPGTVELAYPVDNLLVRISYAGASGEDSDGAPDRIEALAERIGEAL